MDPEDGPAVSPQTKGGGRRSSLPEEAYNWDGKLSAKGEEFAKHLGINLDDAEDRAHAWIAEKAVNENLPEGWSQHEDEEGFLYFYDAVLDRSTWEHPREAHWRRTLEEERRRVQREKEIKDMEDSITRMVAGAQGDRMVGELRAKFLKVDIAELEAQMEVLRSQIEDVLIAIQGERGKEEDEESRRRVFMMQRQGERLKSDLRGMEGKMKDMLYKLQQLLRIGQDDLDIPPETAKDKGSLPVTPDAVKEMCDYLGINIYSEPHLIYIAKKALEDPLPSGWEESIDRASGDTCYVHAQSGKVSFDHPSDPDFFMLVTTQRTKLEHMVLSLYNDPWIKFIDSDGVPYYYNFRTDEISFERPMDAAMRAAIKIQARARGIMERARLEKMGYKVKRIEAPKISGAKAKLVAQLHQNQMDAELAKARREALERKEAEDAVLQKLAEQRKKEAEEEANRVEAEKRAMLETLRRKQERDSKRATMIQKVYRGHLARRVTELPWQQRDRVARVLQRAWMCRAARKTARGVRAMIQRSLAAKRQVQAAALLQQVYRGHRGRKLYRSELAQEGPRQRMVRAANAIKASVLAMLYRSAFLAAMEDLRLMAEQHMRGNVVVDETVGLSLEEPEVLIIPEGRDDAETVNGGSSRGESRGESRGQSRGESREGWEGRGEALRGEREEEHEEDGGVNAQDDAQGDGMMMEDTRDEDQGAGQGTDDGDMGRQAEQELGRQGSMRGMESEEGKEVRVKSAHEEEKEEEEDERVRGEYDHEDGDGERTVESEQQTQERNDVRAVGDVDVMNDGVLSVDERQNSEEDTLARGGEEGLGMGDGDETRRDADEAMNHQEDKQGGDKAGDDLEARENGERSDEQEERGMGEVRDGDDDGVMDDDVRGKGYEMTEPMRVTVDADYDTWSDADEASFKAVLCDVVSGLHPDEIEILRVSRGSVVIDLLINRIDWEHVVGTLAADLALPLGASRLASAGVVKLESPLQADPVLPESFSPRHVHEEAQEEKRDEPAAEQDTKHDVNEEDAQPKAHGMTNQEEDEAARPPSASLDRLFRAQMDDSGGKARADRPVEAAVQARRRDGTHRDDHDSPPAEEGEGEEDVSVRPTSALADRWFREEAALGVETVPQRPQTSSGIPSEGSRKRVQMQDRPKSVGPESLLERGASMSAKYKRPTSAARGRQDAPSSSSVASVRFGRAGSGSSLRVSEAARPAEMQDYLNIEEEDEEQQMLQQQQEQQQQQQEEEEEEAWREGEGEGDATRVEDGDVDEMSKSLGTDYTLDEGTMLMTHELGVSSTFAPGGFAGDSSSSGPNSLSGTHQVLGSDGRVLFTESDSERARELEARLAGLTTTAATTTTSKDATVGNNEPTTPVGKRVHIHADTPMSVHKNDTPMDVMDLSLARTKAIEPAANDGRDKAEGSHEENDNNRKVSVTPSGQGDTVVHTPAHTEANKGGKKTHKRTLMEELEDKLPADCRKIPIQSLPLQFVGRELGSLTEHELFGVGRSMGINTRRLLLQIGGHERALRMMAAVDLERDVKIVKAQAFYRGHLSRRRTADALKTYMQEKAMRAMEESIKLARNTGAALMIQRVARGHAGRLDWRKTLHDKLEKERLEREARYRYIQVHCSKQAQLITRVCKGHIGRNLYRLEAELAERERQLAQFDEMKNDDFDYQFDPDEDDEDDTKIQQLFEQAAIDYGDDASPRGVTQQYEKIIYPERNYPWTKASLKTDVHNAAAKRLQTAYRVHLARMALSHAKRVKRQYIASNRSISARKIQGAYRSYKRNVAEERRRLETDLFNLRTKSAVRIQALYRGAIHRIKIGRRRDKEAELLRERRRMAAVAIQALGRGYIARKQVLGRRKEWASEQLVHRAARKIQARWRGVMARGRIGRIKADRKAYMQEQEKNARNAREERVVLIQAAFRGHLGRELYRERLVEVSALRRLLEVRKRRAAVAFQALFRGYIYRNRRRVQARAARLHRAASRLQKVYRGHLVRNDVTRMRFMNKFGHMSDAVTLVANNYRMHRARRCRHSMVQVMHQSGMARFLQSVYRGHLAREMFRARVHARYKINCTCVLQRAYRMHVARNLYWDLKQQSQERGAALRLQRIYRGHMGRNKVRDFLQRKEREKRNGAAVQLQKVYRGHLGRNKGRTEKNKLKAQYNMGWLATYIEQLEKVADVEHWDLYRHDVVEIAHRVRDMYATFEYEQQLNELKKQGREAPPAPPNVLAAMQAQRVQAQIEAAAAQGAQDAQLAGTAGSGEDASRGKAGGLVGSAEKKGTNPGVAVAPKIHQALQDIAGSETVEKPWHYGKTDRIVKDLVEIADVTTELQKEKLAKAYSVLPSDGKPSAKSRRRSSVSNEEGEDTFQQTDMSNVSSLPEKGNSVGDAGGFDLNLLLGKKKSAKEIDYQSPQIAPSYMRLQPGRPIPTQDTDVISGVPEFDVAERYAALRSRQMMPAYMHDAQVDNVDGLITEPNPFMQDGPILLGTAARPFSPPHNNPLKQPSTLSPAHKRARQTSKVSQAIQQSRGEWNADVVLPREGGRRKTERERLLAEHQQQTARLSGQATADLWAEEVVRDHNASRSLVQGPSPYQKGGGKIVGARTKEDSFQRELNAAERASLEDLRAVLTESKLIQNISPALVQASGLRPDALTLQYAPDSSLPIVIGATANSEQREFELFMDTSKKRIATTASRKKTKLPHIGSGTIGGTISPIYALHESGDHYTSLPEIGRNSRPGSKGSNHAR